MPRKIKSVDALKNDIVQNATDKIIKYSKTALRSAKQFRLNTEILQNEIEKTQRKEIQRIFHAANRRIENIEKSGVYSPAYQAIKGSFDDRQNLAKFAKFSLSGLTDAEIKIQYAKAVAFLQKPTSTASGAKTYEKHLQRELNLTDWQFKTAKEKLMQKPLDNAQMQFAERYLMRYNDTLNAFENAVNDVSNQIETDAQKVINAIENFENKMQNDYSDIMDSFKRFGF